MRKKYKHKIFLLICGEAIIFIIIQNAQCAYGPQLRKSKMCACIGDPGKPQ